MDTDSDLVVTWREYLTAKVRLLVFTTRQVDGDFAVSNLEEATFGSLTADTNAIIFYDVNNDGVVNETEYVSALLDIKYYNSLLINSAAAIPTSQAYLDLQPYDRNNITIRWLDADADGDITLAEYMDAVGQNSLWNLEYTRLRSYEIQITQYQWVNVQGGT